MLWIEAEKTRIETKINKIVFTEFVTGVSETKKKNYKFSNRKQNIFAAAIDLKYNQKTFHMDKILPLVGCGIL